MRPHSIVVAVAAISVIACDPSAPPTCAVSETSPLTSEGVAALKIGKTVEELRLQCQVMRDYVIEEGTQGQPARRLTVVLGADTVATSVAQDKVAGFTLESGRYRTTDSVGVGTTLAELRALSSEFVAGEGGLFARLPGVCGLSFRLAGASAADTLRVAELPSSTPVDLVLVVGCRAQP